MRSVFPSQELLLCGIPMKCPNCGLDTIEGAAFCNHCGTPLQSFCSSCGARNPIGSEFCGSCGSRLISGSPVDSARTESAQMSGRLSSPPTYAGPETRDPPPSPPMQSATCPRCNNVNEPGALYCFSCGLPLDDTSTSSPYSTTSADLSQDTGTGPAYDGSATPITSEPAGFWIRLVAYLIDAAILYVMLIIILLVIEGIFYPESFESESERVFTESLWSLLVSTLIWIIYNAIGWSVWSTTIGKRVLSLYVLRPDGSKIGFGRALARYLSYYVSALPFGIGLIMIGLRSDKRGLHDLITDTVVVRRR